MASRQFVGLIDDALDVRFSVGADSPPFAQDLQLSLRDLLNSATCADEILANLLNGVGGGAGNQPDLTGAEIVATASQGEKREAIQELAKRLSELPQTDTTTALIDKIRALAD
jgi:hypothetical protein